MEKTNDNIKKICNFYMSDWHFTVMLLPYINKEINMKTQIITIFENDMTEKVKTLVGKLNLKNKEEILKINWQKTCLDNFISEIEYNIKSNDKNLLIINGSNMYINQANNEIKNVIYKKEIASKKIKIIDCYDFESNKEKINLIIKKYDGMLNTSGEIKLDSRYSSCIN